MAKADITLRITRLSMPAMYALGIRVEDALRDNPLFPDPPVPIDQLRSLLEHLLALISASKDGSKKAYAARNACALQLRHTLELLATYVRMESKGDALPLIASGFPLRKIPLPIGIPAPCSELKARIGQEQGTIKLMWKPSRGAKYYTVYMAPHITEENWISLGTTTRCSFEVSGLIPDTRHYFKVTPTGVSGTGLPSAVASSVAA